MYDPCTDQVWVKYGYSMKDVCECEGFNIQSPHLLNIRNGKILTSKALKTLS